MNTPDRNKKPARRSFRLQFARPGVHFTHSGPPGSLQINRWARPCFRAWIAAIVLIFLAGCFSSSPVESVFTINTEQHIYEGNGPLISSHRIERRSESCSYRIAYVEWLFYGWGGGLEEARQSVSMQKAASVDHQSLGIFNLTLFGFTLFAQECIVVYGE